MMTAILLVVLPLGGYFMAKNHFTDANYSERDISTYSGLVSVACVIFVLVLYSVIAVTDKSNFEFE